MLFYRLFCTISLHHRTVPPSKQTVSIMNDAVAPPHQLVTLHSGPTSTASHSSTAAEADGSSSTPSSPDPSSKSGFKPFRKSSGTGGTDDSTSTVKAGKNGKAKGNKRAAGAASEDLGDALPTKEQIANGDKVILWNEEGQKVVFGDLRRGKTTVLLFIRHLHCGMCQIYLMGLNAEPRWKKVAEQQARQAANIQLIIVTQGPWSGIKRYREFSGPIDEATGQATRNPFPVYSSPDSKLFKAYGVTKHTLSGGKQSEIAKELQGYSTFQVTVRSIKEVLGAGFGSINGGRQSQLGADFVILAGEQPDKLLIFLHISLTFYPPIDPDGTPAFAHRMQSTRDHTSSDILADHAGLQ